MTATRSSVVSSRLQLRSSCRVGVPYSLSSLVCRYPRHTRDHCIMPALSLGQQFEGFAAFKWAMLNWAIGLERPFTWPESRTIAHHRAGQARQCVQVVHITGEHLSRACGTVEGANPNGRATVTPIRMFYSNVSIQMYRCREVRAWQSNPKLHTSPKAISSFRTRAYHTTVSRGSSGM